MAKHRYRFRWHWFAGSAVRHFQVRTALKVSLAPFLVFVAMAFSCNPANGPSVTFNVDRPSATNTGDCLYQDSSVHRTAGGVTVRSCVDVPQEALDAIERGIKHQIRNSSHYNPTWTGLRNLNEYQVYLVPPTAHNSETAPGSPALLVKFLGSSIGTVEQKQTAGTCIGVDGAMFIVGKGPVTDPRNPSEVLPEQSAEGWKYLDYLEESARNESEHLAEWSNDKAMFNQFAISGDVHPHFPDW